MSQKILTFDFAFTYCQTIFMLLLDGCVLPLQMDYTFFTPLIFSQDGTLLNTENVSETSEDLSISDGGTVIISCAPNYFKKYPTQKQFTAKCKSGTKLSKKTLLTFIYLIQFILFYSLH